MLYVSLLFCIQSKVLKAIRRFNTAWRLHGAFEEVDSAQLQAFMREAVKDEGPQIHEAGVVWLDLANRICCPTGLCIIWPR